MRSKPGSSSSSLAGALLIAHPGLLDPNFRKGVLFISTNHPTEGSFGVMVNRPSGQTVADLLEDQAKGAIATVPVLLGGPVGRDQLIFAAFTWHAATQRMECKHHLGIEEAEELLRKESAAVVRAFVGYAGWGQGQLEAEIVQSAWMVRLADQEFLQPDKAASLWREQISSFGPMFQLIADAPDDLSQN